MQIPILRQGPYVPNVAFAMVQLGMTREDIATVLDLDEDLELLAGVAHEDGQHAP